MVMVVRCSCCMTEYRLNEALLKGAKGACIRCPKCRERIIVENPHAPPVAPSISQRVTPQVVTNRSLLGLSILPRHRSPNGLYLRSSRHRSRLGLNLRPRNRSPTGPIPDRPPVPPSVVPPLASRAVPRLTPPAVPPQMFQCHTAGRRRTGYSPDPRGGAGENGFRPSRGIGVPEGPTSPG